MPRPKGSIGKVHLYKNSFTLTQAKCGVETARVTYDLAIVTCSKCLKASEVPMTVKT